MAYAEGFPSAEELELAIEVEETEADFADAPKEEADEENAEALEVDLPEEKTNE